MIPPSSCLLVGLSLKHRQGLLMFQEIDMKHRVGDGSTGPVLVLPGVPARAWIGGDGAGEDGHL